MAKTTSCRYLLRVEGVNLSNVIDDTDQLSVRRGGGLMILNAPAALKDSLAPEIGDRLTEIATGASIGLFEFIADANTGDDAEAVRVAVEKHLREGSLDYKTREGNDAKLSLKHGTFVVDIVRVDETDDVQQKEQLAVAKNRWSQLQQPTLSLDELWGQDLKESCHWDRTRVATVNHHLPGGKQEMISQTVDERWKYGRDARQRFYHGELDHLARDDVPFAKILAGLAFTDDLKKLSGHLPNADVKFSVPDNLVDKLAVFYVDGNKFGERGRAIFKAEGSSGFREWSTVLREHHRRLLKDLITLTDNDPLWRNGSEIRLETLLWGGDEILWVVPAWKGWEVAEWFFGQPHEVEVGGKKLPLTYGCGLVFCHAKAPIKNIAALAHRLGDLTKTARNGMDVHCLAYEVLESYDDISGDLETHRRRFLPQDADVSKLVINPAAIATHWKTLTKTAALSEFPMRQLYMLTKRWRAGEDFKTQVERLRSACQRDDANK
ncbi:MAG: hypothetical protein ABI619_04235, partial [Betaproteobacteria bacterium]